MAGVQVKCPWHPDSNPSARLYPDGYLWCYRCCKGAHSGVVKDMPEEEPKEPANLQVAFTNIERLPKQRLRGLEFPATENGYFICWPDKSFYKFRRFDDKPRYIGPRGHTPPLFAMLQPECQTLLIVEGEVNALSCAQAPEAAGWSIVSPGIAGNFSQKSAEIKALISAHQRVLCWTDRDAPGVKALWEVARLCSASNRQLSYILTGTDANDQLQDGALAQTLNALSAGRRDLG